MTVLKSLSMLIALVPLLSGATTLATRGNLTVTTDDFYAYQYMNSPKKVEALRSSEKEIQSTIVEVLAPRSYKANPNAHAKLDVIEQRYYAIQLERAPLLAELNILERRVRAEFNAGDALTIARAKEIWATEANRYTTEETADITQIAFDFSIRSYAETVARIAEAQKELSAGRRFEEVLLQYSDEKTVKDTGGRIAGVSSLRTDPLMGLLIFKRLKEGEVSTPTPGRAGFYIVRLDKKYPTRKQPFDEVKGKIFEQMMEDAVKQARVGLLDRLAQTETVIDEKVFENFLIKPDPKLEEKRREIYKNLGIRIAEPADTKQ
jgi:PPIC-type PPIASE domain